MGGEDDSAAVLIQVAGDLQALGPDCERIYEEFVNTLGNLTLTAYNPVLLDASFAEKKARLKGGYEKGCLVISKELHEVGTWARAALRFLTFARAVLSGRRIPTSSRSSGRASLTFVRSDRTL